MLRIILTALSLAFLFPGCTRMEIKAPDFKRVATENKLKKSLSATDSAPAVFANLVNYAKRCFQLSASVTRQDSLDSVTIISEQRAQIKSYSRAPFHGEILIRWYGKPYQPEDEGAILFLAEARSGGNGNAKVSLYGNKIFDNESYFEGFSAVVKGETPQYCPGKK